MKRPKLLIAGLALGASLIAMMALPGSALAGFTVCKTDPTAMLSNGKTVSLWAEIGTDTGNVNGVSYVLHIPAGLRVMSVSYDQYASLESFTWVADQSQSRYETDTTVTTTPGVGDVPVTAWSSMPQGNNTYSATGISGQVLTSTWRM